MTANSGINFEALWDCIDSDILAARKLVEMIRKEQKDEAIQEYNKLKSTKYYKECKENFNESIAGYFKEFSNCQPLDVIIKSMEKKYESIDNEMGKLTGKTFDEYFISDLITNKANQDEGEKTEGED